MSNDILVNRVANSGLITLNLELDYPLEEMVDFDLQPFLFHGLILKEKDFRNALKEHNWENYGGKLVCVFCSTDAIIPVWAYMLVVAYLEPIAHDVFQGTQKEYLVNHYRKVISGRNYEEYNGQRIVIKGCSDRPVPPSAYLDLTAALRPFAQSIMYGEPCSTVPIFKRPRNVSKLKK